jgi:5-methyltetrahydropteroyltriglutamate--homocysteine methyltransferase
MNWLLVRDQPMTVDEYRKKVEIWTRAIHYMTRGVPHGMLRIHCACWGNHIAPHSTDLPLKTVIDLLLDLPGKYLLFEYCSPNHFGDITAFSSVMIPQDKVVVLGVVDQQTPRLETPQTILLRIKIALSMGIPLQQIGISPNCGFGTYTRMDHINDELIEAKLRRLVEASFEADNLL